MFKIIISILIKLIKYTIELIESIEYEKIQLDEDDISKKILNSIELSGYKIHTDTGYEPLTSIHITQPYKHYVIKTSSFKLSCADKHIVFDEMFNQIFVSDLNIGDLIQTINGPESIISIEVDRFKSSMFDVSVDHINHRFYSNGILSHNTICSSIMMLHYVLFNNNKNVLVTANKLDTAVEVLDKIREIYQRLPFFLQQGIINWNQKFMVFENKSRIKGFATTKTSSIGQTADFLYLDEFAYLPDNIAEKFYKSVFPTVSNIENSKIIITSTPNGINLFHRLLVDAEKPEGEKSSYTAKRVYWWQVPKRFMTYIRINEKKMESCYHRNNTIDRILENINTKKVTNEDILNHIESKYPTSNPKLYYNEELKKWVINVPNSKDCTEEDILKEEYLGVRLLEFADITTWKKETIKDIGGEEAFNQEYDLRFINSSRSVLDETIIDEITKNKLEYEYLPIEALDKRLRFTYNGLKWNPNKEVFDIDKVKNYRVIMSIDISEGLGQDYSVINIFKLSPKPIELIEQQKHNYKSIVDFFQLEQIGLYRDNIISVQQLAEIFYCLAFDVFDSENVKAVLEINNYGHEFLAHMPNVFDGRNSYGSSIFFRYKHRADATEEKIGLKVGDNKNLLVKDYKERMESKCIVVSEHTNITEVTTFIKHTTNAGNITYKADGSAHDDIVMTVVDISSVFNKNDFKQIVEDYLSKMGDKSISDYINQCLNNIEYIEPVNYTQVLSIRKSQMNYNRMRNKLLGN